MSPAPAPAAPEETRSGLSSREAARRLVAHGPNELRRAPRPPAWREIVRQLTHPLALLLWLAAALALASGSTVLAAAIVAVVLLNAAFAFAQERQAERAVEALEAFLPPRARVLRDAARREIDARELVPGDLLLIAEGEAISADARLLDTALELDESTLTGESVPVVRERGEAVHSGTFCTAGDAEAIVTATGMHTELGRIAALTARVEREESPLEAQVKRVAWLIAMVAVAAGAAFFPIGLLAGLSFSDALTFAIGLIVANVPEGLLPTITLALALGVTALARSGALVKRLSAVETLGSTTIVCTDKTGTLTENRMQVVETWTRDEPALARAMALCNNADLATGDGDPTELALAAEAQRLGADLAGWRRAHQFRFDPGRRLMSTVDRREDELTLHVKGAPEEVFARCALDRDERLEATQRANVLAARGLRVLAVATRALEEVPERDDAEQRLELLGLVAMFDPPRPEVAGAVTECRAAGIRIIVVTGDAGLTALEVARRVGIVTGEARVVTGSELAEMGEPELDRLLRAEGELLFARSSPETKLRIADALRAQGHVVAMTGDGVNDAPALRRADIGVAMGKSGTEVAREASTMVLTNDNFASIVAAVEAGRRVYDNVRKFILYIFAHATPEVVPFLLFAVSGGLVPLPLTVLQILAIDLGTETLPALALGREPAEPGLMERPPRPRSETIVRRDMLLRAWVWMGLVSAALVLAGFFSVLLRAGWSPGDAVGEGTPLHGTYREATTMTFAGIVACQIGTAFAARTERAALRHVGLRTNPLLLWGIAFEVVFAAAAIYLPPLQAVFATEPLDWVSLLVLVPFPVLVWGVDELRRARRRRS